MAEPRTYFLSDPYQKTFFSAEAGKTPGSFRVLDTADSSEELELKMAARGFGAGKPVPLPPEFPWWIAGDTRAREAVKEEGGF